MLSQISLQIHFLVLIGFFIEYFDMIVWNFKKKKKILMEVYFTANCCAKNLVLFVTNTNKTFSETCKAQKDVEKTEKKEM